MAGPCWWRRASRSCSCAATAAPSLGRPTNTGRSARPCARPGGRASRWWRRWAKSPDLSAAPGMGGRRSPSCSKAPSQHRCRAGSREPLPQARPQWAQVSIGAACVWSGCATFGQGYLARSLWRRRGRHTLLRELDRAGRRSGALGADRVPPHRRAFLRTKKRTRSGRALVCGPRARRSARGAFFPPQ